MSRRTPRLTGFLTDASGVSAVEFALTLPLMLIIYTGGYQVTEALSAYRKMTITTRAVADLTTQYQTMSASDVATVLNASAQIMAPFSTANLTIVLSELTTDSTGKTTVTWSQQLNGTALTPGKTFTLPTGLAQPSTSVVLSQVTYTFTPVAGYKLTGSYTMSDHLYMSPRGVTSITYTGS